MIYSIYLFAQAVIIDQNELGVPVGDLTENNITQGLQIFFGLLGAISLIIVTLAGLRYVISQGDPQSTAKAKNTILYALIGLAINIFAFTIVTFVVERLT